MSALSPLIAVGVAAVLLGSEGERPLGAGEISYLVDPGPTLSATEALAADGWRPVEGRAANAGYTRAAIWLRAELRHTGTEPARRLIEVAYPNLDEVALWTRVGGALAGPTVTGDSLPFSRRPIDYRHFVFPLALEPGQPVELLLRVRSTTSVQVPITVWTPAAFRRASLQSTLLHGAFFGMLLVMVGYNLVLYLAVRERAYLYYVAFVASFALYQAFHHGFTYAHLWPASPWWHAKSGAVAINLTLVFAALFAVSFLDMRRSQPRVHVAMLSLAGLAALNAAASLFVPYSLSARLASVIALVECPLVFAAGVALWRSGMTAARYFVLAWAAFLLGSALFALSKLGLAPYNAFTENALQIGSVAEVLLLSFALADRINTERRERYRAQLDAVRRQEQTAALSRYVPEAVGARVVEGIRTPWPTRGARWRCCARCRSASSRASRRSPPSESRRRCTSSSRR